MNAVAAVHNRRCLLFKPRGHSNCIPKREKSVARIRPFPSRPSGLKGSPIDSVPSQEFCVSFQTLPAVFPQACDGLTGPNFRWGPAGYLKGNPLHRWFMFRHSFWQFSPLSPGGGGLRLHSHGCAAIWCNKNRRRSWMCHMWATRLPRVAFES